MAGGSTLPPVDKLRIAIHIATSVADLHTIDGTKQPSFFHNDSEWFVIAFSRAGRSQFRLILLHDPFLQFAVISFSFRMVCSS